MGISIQEAQDGLSWINSNNEIDELMKTVFNETDTDESRQSNEELRCAHLNCVQVFVLTLFVLLCGCISCSAVSRYKTLVHVG